MKKIYIILISLFVFLFCINSVTAMTLKPSGDTTAKRGEEITLYITLDRTSNEKSVSAVDGMFNYDSSIFTLVSSSNLINNWVVLSDINNKIFSYANLEFNNLITNTNQDIAKIILKVNDNAKYGDTTVEVSNPSATDEEGNGLLIEGGSHIVKVLSDVNTLTNITLSGGNIIFDENTLNYNLTVENSVSNIKIDASLTDNKSTFVEKYGPRTVNLSVGKNLIEIKVKAENNEIRTYTINVTRKEKTVNNQLNKSSNNYLSELKLKEGSIVFSKEQLEYLVAVSYDVDEINFELKTEHSKATTNIKGNKDLKVGENTVTITVMAEDGSKREYKIFVTRKEKDLVLSNNSKLKSLTIKGYNIDFDSDKYSYDIRIGNESSLDIIYTKDDSKSNVTITGNENLKDKSMVTVAVIAEDGSISTYKIKIKKDNSMNIILLSAIIILLILIIYLVIKRKRQKKIK